jgi:predicted nucleic acid-binding protein
VPVFYLDTSALVKRYAREAESVWVGRLCAARSGNDIFTVRLTGPEVISALFRKARTGQVLPAYAQQAATRFKRDWQLRYDILDINEVTTLHAMTLAETYGLRGYDAVHMAVAVELHDQRQQARLPALTFVSADAQQLSAARGEGLLTEDPNQHR